MTGGTIADFRETGKAFPVRLRSGFTSEDASKQKREVFSHFRETRKYSGSFGEEIAVWRNICAELSELSEPSLLLNGLSMR
ncbi:MAG: hypothetical protein U5L46_04970 [Agrobacterium sp.]|nr:hypothetical protein [Agrobacterium sp.]